MAETEAIARMSAKLADELFPSFYWEKIGPENQNWECVNQVEHKRKKSKTHPSDAVWRYRHPYTGNSTYIIFDYKSLADKSIQSGTMGAATRQLGNTLDCAMVSQEWQDLYFYDDGDLQGCLFVYNHDHDYKRDLAHQIYSNLNSDYPKSWPSIEKPHEILIIDPYTIIFLYSIDNDLARLYAKKKIPDLEYRGFYQPDKQIQYQKLASSNHYKVPILLDQLTSETIIIRYDPNQLGTEKYESGKEGFLVYYRDTGENVEEFIYLIDQLFTYQIIDHAAKISIRILSPHKNAFSNLKKAIQQYSSMVSSSESIAKFIEKRLDIVKIESFDQLAPRYFETELGMIL